MPVFWIFVIITGLAAAGYVLGRGRALASAGGDQRNLHSLPSYYGSNAAIFTFVPAFLILLIWLVLQPIFISLTVQANIPDSVVPEGSTIGLVMSDVRRLADGLDTAVSQGVITDDYARSVRVDLTDIRARLGEAGVALGSNLTSEIMIAAQRFRSMTNTGNLIKTIVVLLIALGGLGYALSRTQKDFRARNTVEATVRVLLIVAASIAILTTIGIVLSLIFNTIEFFFLYPIGDFFGSLTWSPSFGGGSDLGVWPLLWGTLYISVIALLVAVPIGLFSAIYLSEYASPAVRSVAKPMLEVLAGIPTIVYGLFALLTVGPMLVDAFGDDGYLGLGWMQGGTAVMTAGLVMGIMLIPFVSSLSDDIINAVPQAMRDGSLGLGATHSETVRQVILPAALPGIVGAVLLAASRAIGETMIVVLGAGAAARISANPFDAMTTITAKIVSQLTGDADFASPEVLVAFALGMTLFVITLGLNVFALYIVRKYREQYE
ncbi:phosphate ABC transporter permease subunit PstC [Pseudaestuariivita rosea]|uniref:phosphate ABC transporter permease subunit PstC n=1 Tax=Pseudaestuariivita rosea TaxID=2763263 RepID=UPI001ABB0374|nr:phosphate ABC transporter permease subunit PstC [Pseudaestuariivita rosea]